MDSHFGVPGCVPIRGYIRFGGAGSGCLAAPRYKWLFPERLRFSPLWALLKREGSGSLPPFPHNLPAGVGDWGHRHRWVL